jgi:hypothetical protein
MTLVQLKRVIVMQRVLTMLTSVHEAMVFQLKPVIHRPGTVQNRVVKMSRVLTMLASVCSTDDWRGAAARPSDGELVS